MRAFLQQVLKEQTFLQTNYIFTMVFFRYTCQVFSVTGYQRQSMITPLKKLTVEGQDAHDYTPKTYILQNGLLGTGDSYWKTMSFDVSFSEGVPGPLLFLACATFSRKPTRWATTSCKWS